MEVKLETMMQHDWKTSAHNTDFPPPPPHLFIYNRRGWILRSSSYFRTLPFPPESHYLLALWLFQRKTFIRSLLQGETGLIPSSHPHAIFTLSATSVLLFLLPLTCLSFLLTCSPGHACCLLQCQSQRKWGGKSCESLCWVRADKEHIHGKGTWGICLWGNCH